MKKHRGGSSRPPRFKYACTSCGDREVKLSGRMGSDGRGIYQCATCGAMRDQAPPHFAPITTVLTVRDPQGNTVRRTVDVPSLANAVHAPEVLPGRDRRREDAIAWAESIGAPPTGVLAVDTLELPRREREEFVFDETALKALASKMRPWFTKVVGA